MCNFRTLVIDDPVLMKEILNDPAFNGRLQNELFTYMSQDGHGNNNNTNNKHVDFSSVLIVQLFFRIKFSF